MSIYEFQRVYDEDATIQQKEEEVQEATDEISVATAEEQRANAQKEMQELVPKFISAMKEGLESVEKFDFFYQ